MALHTPLHDVHAAAGATFIEFGGWEMPLQFAGIVAEHMVVRQGAGLFDVSHMGKVLVSGAAAWEFLSRLSTNDVPRKPMRARYTHLLTDGGHIIDDVIITCLAPDRYFVVCNAGPRERVLAWMGKHASGERIQDVTHDYLCLALQGPKAARVLQILTQHDVGAIRGFGGAHCDLLLGERLGTGRTPASPPPEMVGRGPFPEDPALPVEDFCFVTRTGYTGEDGFEMFPPKELAIAVWNGLLAAGGEAGLRPVGLGARDTLRLEKGFLLSGTDFDGRQTPLECASAWLVKWDHEFIGREALRRQEERDDYDRLVGLVLQDRGVPRHGCPVLQSGKTVGAVTSGTMSPSLKTGIALARVRPEAAPVGTVLEVKVRDRPLRAVVKKPPFL
jgi:aminomethyltransferase